MKFTRRDFLTNTSAALMAGQTVALAPGGSPISQAPTTPLIKTRGGESPPTALKPVDKQIWEEELSDYVPQKIFDAHCHMFRASFDLRYQDAMRNGRSFTTQTVWPECDLEIVKKVESVVMPGRKITRLAFPFPFKKCDFDNSNPFVAGEMRKEPGSAALMLVQPSMTAEHVEKTILEQGQLGVKPYSSYCVTEECRITDFLPEHQIAVADRYGLIIMLHVGMRKSFADPRNINDFLYLTEKYQRAKWILAHGARSFAPFPIEKAGPKFRGIPNVWYEVSAVCVMESFDALFSNVDIDRILYGADSGDVGFARGKSIVYGYKWGDLTPKTDRLGGEMTFYVYEQLRAMRRASVRFGLTKAQVEDMFFNTGHRLVESVAEGMRNAA